MQGKNPASASVPEPSLGARAASQYHTFQAQVSMDTMDMVAAGLGDTGGENSTGSSGVPAAYRTTAGGADPGSGGGVFGAAVKTRGIMDLPPFETDNLMMTGSNGVTRWVTMKKLASGGFDEADEETALENIYQAEGMVRRTNHGVMLDSMADLFEKMKDDVAPAIPAETLREQQKQLVLQESIAAAAADATAPPVEETTLDRNLFAEVEDSLWVSKYTPRSFMDLLSDETSNLALLQWLKEWQPFVFGKVDPLGQTQRSKDAPENKIALVTGPPGVGKSTLARVVASHCGYEVVEVNASVDRSPKALRDLFISTLAGSAVSPNAKPKPLDAATQRDPSLRMKARLMRPKLLILDEIDGIAANVIPILLKDVEINRPVICLANDVYAPSLKELRSSVGFLQQIPPIAPTRLLSRLEVIVQKERVTGVNKPALADLSHMCNGDVRSCLNNLQLLCALSKKGKNVHALLTHLKFKDGTMNLWTLWKEMLSRRERSSYFKLLDGATMGVQPNTKESGALGVSDRRAPALAMTATSRTVDPGYRYILQLLDNAGDLDTLLDGLHQHYPQQRYSDHTLDKTVLCADSFSFHDRWGKLVFETHSMGLLTEFGKHLAASCHSRCSSMAKGLKVQFPRDAASNRQKVKGNSLSLRSFSEGLTAAQHMYYFNSQSSWDLVTLMPPMLIPQMKFSVTVSQAAMSEKEKAIFQECVDRHVTYGLTYHKRFEFRNSKPGEGSGSGAGPSAQPPDAEKKTQEGGSGGDSTTQGGGAPTQSGPVKHESWVIDPDLDPLVFMHRPKTAENSFIKGFAGYSSKKGGFVDKKDDGDLRRRFWVRNDVKELLAAEIDKAKIQHRIQAFAGSGPRTEPAKARLPTAVRSMPTPPPAGKPVKRDFFGRPLTEAQAGKKRGIDGTVIPPSAPKQVTLSYAHVEGSTNEIRREANLSDFV